MGVIDSATRSTYTAPDGTSWIYYRDANTPSIFYVIERPTIAVNNGLPSWHITQYVDAQKNFLSALFQITVGLSPAPAAVQSAIAAALGGGATYQGMPYQDLGGPNVPNLNLVTVRFASVGLDVSRSASAIPSLSGTENTTINFPDLTQSDVNFLCAYFSAPNAAAAAALGTVDVVYDLTVTAHLQGVTARVQMDTSLAFKFQRTYKWVT